MIPIKIQCGCGQRYAFDVEPVNGRTPFPVACPVCSTDGTAAANDVIAASMPAQSSIPVAVPVAVPVAAARLRAVASAPPASAQPAESAAPAPQAEPRKRVPLAGQLDEVQATTEARSKILWGDPPDNVISFLRGNGFSQKEASSLVRALSGERAAMVRKTGIRKIMVGIGLMFVPVISFLIFTAIGYLEIKLFALTVMVGIWGAWMCFNGAFMVLLPKAEGGDVADH